MVPRPPLASLRGEFAWLPAIGRVDLDDETSGELRLLVGGRLIWGRGADGVDWHWSDLLTGLTENWDRLLFEGWLDPHPSRVGSLIDAIGLYQDGVDAQRRLEGLDDAAACGLLDQLYEWEQAHSLARFLPGLDVPEVYVWASGAEVNFETEQVRASLSRADATVALGKLGEQVAARLRLAGLAGDPVVRAWEERRVVPGDRWAATVTGLEEDVLASARGPIDPAQAWGNEAGDMAATAWTELAKLLRHGGERALRPLFQAVADLPPIDGRWATCLDVAERGRSVAGSDRLSFAFSVAEELRGIAGLGSTDAFGVEAIAASFGLHLSSSALGHAAPTVVAVHRPGYLPLIVLNTSNLGPAREAERRWASVDALSQLIQAGLAGEPWAGAVALAPASLDASRLALELGMPGRGVDELAMDALGTNVTAVIARHYALPVRAAALQVANGGAWQTLSASEHARVGDLLAGSLVEPVVRHVRNLSAA